LGQVLDLKTKLISIFAAAVICLGADCAMAAHAGLSSATSADATAHAKPVSVTPEEAEHGPSQKPVEIARMFGFPITNSMVFSWIVAVGLIVFAQAATRQMKPVPDGAQNFWEWLVEGLYTFLEDIIGSHLVEQTFWVSIVDVYSDEHRAGRIEGFAQDRCNFIRMLNSKAGGAESFGVFDVIDRTKINSRPAVVLDLLLHAHHVVVAIDPDHVNQMGIQTDCCLQLICGE
jgi:hypothetical protein